MEKQFNTTGMNMPPELTFETMSKSFMDLVAERYPSADKVKAQARNLGIENNLVAKIIVFSQFRDAIREVAVTQIYRNLQHRDELFLAIIDALEDYEEELDEQQGEEEENEAWEDDDEEDEETEVKK
jgi:type III secretion protein W